MFSPFSWFTKSKPEPQEEEEAQHEDDKVVDKFADLENRPAELIALEKRFHEVIIDRAKSMKLSWADDPNKELPIITSDLVDKEYPDTGKGIFTCVCEYFPVPGMYGGFAYRVRTEDGVPTIQAESGVRVCDGAEQAHLITPDKITLVDAGWGAWPQREGGWDFYRDINMDVY